MKDNETMLDSILNDLLRRVDALEHQHDETIALNEARLEDTLQTLKKLYQSKLAAVADGTHTDADAMELKELNAVILSTAACLKDLRAR